MKPCPPDNRFHSVDGTFHMKVMILLSFLKEFGLEFSGIKCMEEL
jgi:hypothetical protein